MKLQVDFCLKRLQNSSNYLKILHQIILWFRLRKIPVKYQLNYIPLKEGKEKLLTISIC